MRPDEITVLSPHRDDAIFSLALSIARWIAVDVRVRVVNIFTRSAYAPRTAHVDTDEISTIRRREDVRALSRLGVRTVINLDMLDAPLRLGLAFEQVMRPEAIQLVTDDAIVDLANRLRLMCSRGLVVAPLGLGHHVDHEMVHLAAIRAFAPARLAFFEDLPYASWTPQEEVAARIQKLPVRYIPRLFKMPHAQARKRTLARLYASQIGWDEAARTAQFLETYRGAERLWVPAHSPAWHRVKARATTLRPWAILRRPTIAREQTR